MTFPPRNAALTRDLAFGAGYNIDSIPHHWYAQRSEPESLQ